MYIIIKDRQTRRESPESALYRRITEGNISDSDIEMAINSGDSKIKNALERRVDRGLKAKRDLDDKYGKDSFDYLDRKGNPVKETQLVSDEEMRNPTSRQETEDTRRLQLEYAKARRAGKSSETVLSEQSQREMFPWAFPKPKAP